MKFLDFNHASSYQRLYDKFLKYAKIPEDVVAEEAPVLDVLLRNAIVLVERLSGFSLGEHTFEIEQAGKYHNIYVPVQVGGNVVWDDEYEYEAGTYQTLNVLDYHEELEQVVLETAARLYYARGGLIDLYDIYTLLPKRRGL